MEFDKVTPEIPEILINTNSSLELVAEVIRWIRVGKEKMLSLLGNAASKKKSNIIITNLVHFCIFWLNAIPVKAGISSIYGPRELISQQK